MRVTPPSCLADVRRSAESMLQVERVLEIADFEPFRRAGRSCAPVLAEHLTALLGLDDGHEQLHVHVSRTGADYTHRWYYSAWRDDGPVVGCDGEPTWGLDELDAALDELHPLALFWALCPPEHQLGTVTVRIRADGVQVIDFAPHRPRRT